MEHPIQDRSFPDLVQELSQPLLRYLLRYVGDRAIAEDLLQEALLRMSRSLSGFEGRASAKTWAYSIATNAAIDYLRKPERRVQIVDIDDTTDLIGAEPRADEKLVVDEMNACVRQVINSLSEDYRTALVLHELEGLAAQEIADVCGCSLATAKIRIHRSRLRLKEALQQQCKFYRDSDDVFRCDRKQ